MSHIIKTYRSAYVLEQTKLNRLVAVLRERIAVPPDQLKEQYEIRHRDHTAVTVESLDRLYEFHNSGKKSIDSLVIQVSRAIHDDEKERSAYLSFTTDDRSGAIQLMVVDDDPRWAADTFAAIEEQVERCLKADLMYTLASPLRISIIPLLLISLLIAAFSVLLSDSSRDLSIRMWLAKSDIQQIAAEIDASPTFSQEQHLAIFKRQIKNLQSSMDRKAIRITWPIAFVAFPALLAIICFVYLINKCYPPTVFLWGDAEEWYQNIIKKRNYVWTTILTLP